MKLSRTAFDALVRGPSPTRPVAQVGGVSAPLARIGQDEPAPASSPPSRALWFFLGAGTVVIGIAALIQTHEARALRKAGGF